MITKSRLIGNKKTLLRQKTTKFLKSKFSFRERKTFEKSFRLRLICVCFNTILEDIRDKVKYYIKTFGCQMNVYDSQRIAHILQNMGHTAADAPEDADIIIFNTCHIREKAAEKLFSDLGRINLIKEERQAAGKETIIGVVGCVVQAEDEQIAKRAPFVNFATGPLTYYRIPEILGKIAQQKNICLIDTEFTSESKFDHLPQNRAEGGCSYLAIQEGCNNFCTYCIVPLYPRR